MRLINPATFLQAIVMRLAADKSGAAAADAAISIAKIAVFSSFFPLGLRIIAWLQEGIWPVMTLDSLGLDAPRIGWVGAQTVLNTAFSLPVEIVAFVFCSIVYAIAGAILDDRSANRKLARPS